MTDRRYALFLVVLTLGGAVQAADQRLPNFFQLHGDQGPGRTRSALEVRIRSKRQALPPTLRRVPSIGVRARTSSGPSCGYQLDPAHAQRAWADFRVLIAAGVAARTADSTRLPIPKAGYIANGPDDSHLDRAGFLAAYEEVFNQHVLGSLPEVRHEDFLYGTDGTFGVPLVWQPDDPEGDPGISLHLIFQVAVPDQGVPKAFLVGLYMIV